MLFYGKLWLHFSTVVKYWGLIFEKSYDKLPKNLVWVTKNVGWACDYQKILQKTYEKLTTTLQVSYENIKFVASDVIGGDGGKQNS